MWAGVYIMNRALRRHHRARMLKGAMLKIRAWEETPKDLHGRASRRFNNMKGCSCSMCCNERRNPWTKRRDRLTIQERRAEDSFKDTLDH